MVSIKFWRDPFMVFVFTFSMKVAHVLYFKREILANANDVPWFRKIQSKWCLAKCKTFKVWNSNLKYLQRSLKHQILICFVVQCKGAGCAEKIYAIHYFYYAHIKGMPSPTTRNNTNAKHRIAPPNEWKHRIIFNRASLGYNKIARKDLEHCEHNFVHNNKTIMLVYVWVYKFDTSLYILASLIAVNVFI